MTPMTPMMTVDSAVVADDAGDRLGDVAEAAVHALREDELLALLGGVGLDDADAARAPRSAGR